MGLEEAPIRDLPSFLQIVKQRNARPKNMTPRWWLAPSYEPIAKSEDGLSFQLKGQAVKAMTEEEFVAEGGEVKGTGKATATNNQGEFVLEGVDKEATLVISGVNIETKDVRVGGKTEILIRVKLRVQQAEAVVVTGYQALDSRRSAGSFGYGQRTGQ